MDEERRRRIAAARGYAGLSRAKLGEVFNVKEDTVKRWEDGTNKRPLAPHAEEALLRDIAAACGLPEEFFYVDFAGAGSGVGVEHRLARLEERLAVLERRVPDDYEDIEEEARGLGDLDESEPEREPGSVDTPPPEGKRDEDDQAPPGETRSGE